MAVTRRTKSPSPAKSSGGKKQQRSSTKAKTASADGYVDVINRPAKLHRVEPYDFMWMPKWIRLTVGYGLMIWFSCLFLTVPSFLLLLFPFMWKGNMFYASSTYLLAGVLSLLFPEREFVFARKIYQLWFELLDFRCNLEQVDVDYIEMYDKLDKDRHLITCMHPHGIVPYQAAIWAAFCHQNLEALYGFGATADVVLKVPFLRNVLSSMSAGKAGYKVCYDGLMYGKAPCCNNAGRKPKNMFVLPGGIAEVFHAKIGEHAVVWKNRRGLVKLALETNSELVPTYVFGGNDFLHNFATGDSVIAKMSRKLKMGVTFFYGYLGLPFLPFTPNVSLCMGPPLKLPAAVDASGAERTKEDRAEELHANYCTAITALFDHYKAEAGYPDATLEIV